ncbi:DJ-1/PfpI family protein, partial [Planktotalea sp.]|uniref:DJ-1/PfpI family protein n=1 Tax=Planktotalea sp. TaxID=2029877 RepID=UPI003297EDEC
MSAVLGLEDLLGMANRFAAEAGVPQLSFKVLSTTDLTQLHQFDAIVLPPNLTGVRGDKDKALHRWIKQQHAGGASLCSACAGAFWLGHAGLLDGRIVTTHWALEDELKTCF